MPEKLPLIAAIELQNFLFFGPEPMELELKRLVFCVLPLIPIRRHISFTREGQRFKLENELIENSRPDSQKSQAVRFFYCFQKGHPEIEVYDSALSHKRILQWDDVDFDQYLYTSYY